jgi:toxin ParE1/3/4
MKIKVRFSNRSLRDLNDLFEYILPRGGEIVARNYIEQIRGYCLKFEIFPERGVLRDDIRSNLRLIPYRKRVTIAIIYMNGVVTILRVFGRGQNIKLELS